MTLPFLTLLTNVQVLWVVLNTSWLGPGRFCMFLLGAQFCMDSTKMPHFRDVPMASFLLIRTGFREGKSCESWRTSNCWCLFWALTSIIIIKAIHLNGLVRHVSGFCSYDSGVLKMTWWVYATHHPQIQKFYWTHWVCHSYQYRNLSLTVPSFQHKHCHRQTLLPQCIVKVQEP